MGQTKQADSPKPVRSLVTARMDRHHLSPRRLGIGGEYTAINSVIDELIPSHYRGRVDIAVNGTYWAGAASGAFANLFLLANTVV